MGDEYFYPVPSGVAADKRLKGKAPIVYAYLRFRQGDNGRAWPSITTIAGRCGTDPRTVRRAILLLERLGLLIVHRDGHHGTVNHYTAAEPPCEPENTEPRTNCHPGQSVTPDKLSPGTEWPPTPDKMTGHPGQIVRAPRTNCPPIKNNKNNREQEEEQAVPKPLFTEADCLAVYHEYPRKIGRTAALAKIRGALVIVAKRNNVPDPKEWMIDRVQWFAKSDAGKAGKFCPHPATWFNQGRYDDDESEWRREYSASPGSRLGRCEAPPGKYAHLD